MTRAELEAAIVDFVAAATGVTSSKVLWTSPAVAVTGQPPRVALTLSTTAVIGHAAESVDGEPPSPSPGAEVAVSHETFKRATLNVDIQTLTATLSASAYAYAEALQQACSSRDATAALRNAGAVIESVGAARDLSELVGALFVTRVSLDLTLSYTVATETRVGYIATVEATNAVVDPATLVTFEVT